FQSEHPLTLQTDACSYGISYILGHRINNRDHVIAYGGRTLTPAEKNYTISELECLAVVTGMLKFRHFCYGHHKVIVVTDHHALCWLMRVTDASGRLLRWSLRLQEFSFDIEYKSGRKHVAADCISRYPPLTKTSEIEEMKEHIPLFLFQDEENSSLGTLQRQDSWCGKIFSRLPELKDNYTLKDNVLFLVKNNEEETRFQ
ncbi:KRAB-A domain-containing protein-like protein, partial [Leptotrombidium deliense]